MKLVTPNISMKKSIPVFLLFIFLTGINLCKAQQHYAPKDYYLVDSLELDQLSPNDRLLVDSCLKVFHTAKHDTDKINVIISLIEESWDDNLWPKYNMWMHQFVEKKLKASPSTTEKQYLLKYLAESYNNIGFYYGNLGNVKQSLLYLHKGLKIQEEIDFKEGIAASLNNIGIIYRNQGEIIKALEYWHKALKIQEEIGDKEGAAYSLNNIGAVYEYQGDIEKGLEYYHKSLKIQEEVGHKPGIAYCLNNIGNIYSRQGEYDKAFDYLNKSLILREEVGDKKGVGNSLISIGYIYQSKANNEKAIEYYTKSLSIQNEINYLYGSAISLYYLGDLYCKNNDLKNALTVSQRSLEIGQELGVPETIKQASKILSDVYLKQHKGKEALEMYKLYITMKDSISNEEIQKASAKQQAKYEYEKQKAIDDAQNEKQLAIEQKAKEKQEVLTYATTGGLGLVGIFLIVVFNRLKVTRKQKLVIEEQKQEVEQQKAVVEQAHDLLEEKNKEITDSIHYAKRIQAAILPPDKVVKECLKESFVLYKPKDIVAGDFYWLETIKAGNHHLSNSPQGENLVLFAAADCTGHGVPGAMVSVVCNNALNRSVREHGLTDPGEILDKTRQIVIEEFEKSDEEVKDGMDIALCSLKYKVESEKLPNTQNPTLNTVAMLKYAGANNPLWIIRKGELTEIKANKQPIGKFDNPEPYTTHTITVQKGDTIYIFTDGYIDQFGGKNNKKYKAKAFRELLLSIQDGSMEEQKKLIDKTFETWKGELEQIDDVCIIGVRI